MPTLLNKSELDKLIFVLNGNKLKKITEKYSQDEIDALMQGADLFTTNTFGNIKKFNDKFNQGLLSAGEAISSPVYILWYLCCSFAAITFSVICLTLLPAALVVGGIYFYSTYKEEEKNSEKQNNTLQLLALKLYAISAMIDHMSKESNEITPVQPNLEENRKIKPKDKHFLSKLRKSLGVALAVISTVLGTFYSLGIVFSSCNLVAVASLMLGPYGIVAALGAGIAVGIYFGYKNFQAATNAELIEKYQKAMEKELTKKYEQYDELKNELAQKSQNIEEIKSTQNNSVEPTQPNNGIAKSIGVTLFRPPLFDRQRSKVGVLPNKGGLHAPRDDNNRTPGAKK